MHSNKNAGKKAIDRRLCSIDSRKAPNKSNSCKCIITVFCFLLKQYFVMRRRRYRNLDRRGTK